MASWQLGMTLIYRIPGAAGHRLGQLWLSSSSFSNFFYAFLEQLKCAFPMNHAFGASIDFDPSKSGAQGGQFLRRIFAPNALGSGGT